MLKGLLARRELDLYWKETPMWGEERLSVGGLSTGHKPTTDKPKVFMIKQKA